MSLALINGQAYVHSSIEIIYGGITLPSVTSLDYGEDQGKTMNFGTGNRPVSYGVGGIEAGGTIELSMNDIEAIRDSAPEGALVLLPPMDIIIVFKNPQKPLTHTIKNLVWIADRPSSTQGDTDIKSSNGFVASQIKWR